MVNKQCIQCKILKSESEFHWRSKARQERHARCKQCSIVYRREYRASHLNVVKAREERYRQKCREAVKSGIIEPKYTKCCDCGCKKLTIEFGWNGKSLGRRSIRCRKCQSSKRKAEYLNKRGEYLSKARTVAKLKHVVETFKEQPCMDCKETYPTYVMDFDHRDPSTKITKVSTLIFKGSLRQLLDEIKKCDVVCANCHKIRTHKRKQEKASAK